MIKTTYIYGLQDPYSNEICYIGKSNDPQRRIRHHLLEGKYVADCLAKGKKVGHDNDKQWWLGHLLYHDKEPLLVILEECSIDKWRERERYWYEKLLDDGAYLFNHKKAIGIGQ